jgi:hypothetical protein
MIMRIHTPRFGRALSALITSIFLWFTVNASAAAPTTPENLQPAWLFGEMMLTWNEVPGATSYNVYRYDPTNSVWVVAATGLTAPRYREANSEPTSYTVTAVNADGESAPPPAVTCVQTGDGFTLMYNEWNSPKYDTSASIQWMIDLVVGADGMLEVGTSPTNLMFMGWDTNYTGMHRIMATNLTPATFYFARLTSVASNRTGVSGWITFWTMQTNQPPIVSDQSFNTWEDPWQPVQFWLNGWDPDYPPQPVTFSILSGPSHGTLTYSNYTYWYIPDTNWFGTDLISFVGTDGQLTSAPGTITITVQSINDPPIGINQSVVTGQDMPIEIILQANDVENDPFSFYIATWPMNGWLETVGTNFIFHPGQGRVGTDTFSFIPYDSSYGQQASVTITITNVNDAPATTNMYVGVHANASYTGELWVADADGDAVTCEVVTGTANGTVTVSGTNFTYTPNPGTYFSDSFTYRAFDGQAYSTEGTVWIWVRDTNNVPEAHDQPFTATRNIESSIYLISWDPDGDPVRVLVINAPTNGTLQLFPFASVNYRPATNYLGPDSFSYQVFDGTATSGVATVTITVEPPNDPPIAYSASLTATSGIALSFQLMASDPDGDALTYIVTSPPSHGELTGAAPNLVYTPAPGFIGNDSFTFKANDGKVDGNTATVTITVLRPNFAPVAASQSLSLAEDTSKAVTLTGTDADGDPLTFRILSGPAHGTLTGTGANRVYRPATNYNGADSFTFTANDGITDGNTATVSLTVTPVNDAPVFLTSPNASYTLQEDWIIYFGVMAGDPDGDALTYRIVTPPAHGTLNTNNFQNLQYQGFPRFSGVDSFTWRANDGQVDGPLGTVTITVTGPNDAPSVTNQTARHDAELCTAYG